MKDKEQRVIKFRAWDSFYKRMLDHDWLISAQVLYGAVFSNPRNDLHFMQFTGLTDKEGKEIYEGDIVEFLDGSYISTESGLDTDEFYERGAVEWEPEKQGWDVTHRNDVDWIDVWTDVRVVGNIYQNPELLK